MQRSYVKSITALKGNNNTDEGFIKVNDCTFAYSQGTAIRIVGPGCKGCPFGVDDCKDTTCPANPHPNVGSYSTQVIVKDCVFKHNDQALVVWSDWGVLSNSWITTSCNMTDKAVRALTRRRLVGLR